MFSSNHHLYAKLVVLLNKKDWQSMDKNMRLHHLSLYTKLMTVFNKEDWQSMKQKAMSHHPQHHFITQYISFRCTTVNEIYQMTRMGVAGHAGNNQISH